MKLSTLAIVSVSILLTACVSSINKVTADNHAYAAHVAQSNNDWDTARRHWAKALVNAQLGDESTKKLAVFNYEYGRALGVTCFFDESEKYLQNAMKLDKQVSGPVYMSLLELARLNYDQNKFAQAVVYFEKLPTIYNEVKLDALDPIGTALVYEEYSVSLNRTNDKSKSKNFERKANSLRSYNPHNFSKSERTPYGTQCLNKS